MWWWWGAGGGWARAPRWNAELRESHALWTAGPPSSAMWLPRGPRSHRGAGGGLPASAPGVGQAARRPPTPAPRPAPNGHGAAGRPRAAPRHAGAEPLSLRRWRQRRRAGGEARVRPSPPRVSDAPLRDWPGGPAFIGPSARGAGRGISPPRWPMLPRALKRWLRLQAGAAWQGAGRGFCPPPLADAPLPGGSISRHRAGRGIHPHPPM